jgi:hypothetical protein
LRRYTYQVTVNRIPYGSPSLTIAAIDAAGNRERPTTVIHVCREHTRTRPKGERTPTRRR